MSFSTLRRRLADYGLRRRSHCAPTAVVWNLIRAELQGPGIFIIINLLSCYSGTDITVYVTYCIYIIRNHIFFMSANAVALHCCYPVGQFLH